MKEQMAQIIWNSITRYAHANGKLMIWEYPIVKFASARDERFLQLKELVVADHYLPTDYLENAESVLSYFIPFKAEIPKSNKDGLMASAEWADSYLTTNAMFTAINNDLVAAFCAMGFDACPPRDAGMIGMDNPRSRWSQRHVAYIAGHGTFGLNNMLISDKGSAGRYASVITSMPAAPDPMPIEERCLCKRNGSCGLCVSRCPVGALTKDGFDRFKCLEQCMKNDAIYPGADVCGKCIVELPCSRGSFR